MRLAPLPAPEGEGEESDGGGDVSDYELDGSPPPGPRQSRDVTPEKPKYVSKYKPPHMRKQKIDVNVEFENRPRRSERLIAAQRKADDKKSVYENAMRVLDERDRRPRSHHEGPRIS